MKHPFFGHLLVAAITVVAVLALDLYVNFLSAANLPAVAAIVIAMLIAAAALNAVLFRMLSAPIHFRELKAAADESKKVLADIRAVLEKARAVVLGQERLLLSNWVETELIEKRSKEVWILTFDIYRHLNNKKYIDIVKSNIGEGTRYWWLYPAHFAGEAEDLKEKLGVTSAHADSVCFTPIGGDAAKYFLHDVMLYDPQKDTGIVLLCDVNGRKRTAPEQSLDMPVNNPDVLTRYRLVFIALAGERTPPWF
jgi:nucleotide-binding universal stress UspA family protein